MRILLLVVLLSLAGWATPGKRLGPCARTLPVLCYHEVADKATNDLTISTRDFARHMQYLKAHGYHPVRLEDARGFWWGSKALPGKPILISFDDGYEGVYRRALPILQHYKFPASMFLVVGHVGFTKPIRHLTWPECRQMKDSQLFEFGSHTYDLHCYIRERLQQRGIYPNQVVADLRKSARVLKQKLGVTPKAFAWPYGHYNVETINLAAKAGFSMQFTIDFGATRSYDGTLRIHRYLIREEDRDIRVFAAKLSACRNHS